ncbi:membrane dipeptidase [Parashewanella spongiae]|uniref:membrane dipeptidase n=1 Tax=Parashewanella spongiae TaxID=342950 RepID=UPI0035DE40EA
MDINQTRRALLKGLSALAASSSLLSIPVLAQKKRMYIDGLSFLPEDLADLSKSKLSAYICDISDIEAIKQADGTTNYKRTYKACLSSIKAAQKRVDDNPKQLILGLSSKDIDRALQTDKTAVYFQIQGADCVEADNLQQSWQQLDSLHNHGLRVLQLTHHYGNQFAGGALDNNGNHSLDLPLTANGKQLITELNNRKIIIDASHSSPKSALETAKLSHSPIVQTHGACRAIVNHARCSPDEVIKAIADTGGVFGIFMMSFWLSTANEPQVSDYIRHIKHVIKVGGIEAVGVANDYPLKGQKNLLTLSNNNLEGVKQYLEWWHSLRQKNVLGYQHEPKHVVIPMFNHIDRMNRIDHELSKAGFSAAARDKIMGQNWKRVIHHIL